MKRREFIALGSAVVARPLTGRAQQPSRVQRIAIVHPSLPVSKLFIKGGPGSPFLAELEQLGRVEGINLVVDRFSDEDRGELAELAREVVRGSPDVIVTVGMAKWLKMPPKLSQ